MSTFEFAISAFGFRAEGFDCGVAPFGTRVSPSEFRLVRCRVRVSTSANHAISGVGDCASVGSLVPVSGVGLWEFLLPISDFPCWPV